MPNAFILGGTGQIGLALAERLLAEGWQVTLGSRGNQSLPPHIAAMAPKRQRVDRSDTGANGLGASFGSGFDLLVDTIAFDDRDARQLLDVQQDVGQVIAISSASVYCDEQGRTLDEARQNGFPELPHRISEAQPTVEPGPSTYSTRKVAMERTLLDHANCPAAVLRPCAIHGPYSKHPREWWFVKRLLDGRSQLPVAYCGQSRFQTSATSNIAALVSALAVTRPSGIFNIGDSDSPNVLEIGNAIIAECGIEAVPVPIETDTYPPSIGATPWSVPKRFTVGDAKARQIGYCPVGTYADTVGETCRWLLQQDRRNWRELFPQLAAYPYNLFDYQSEDKFFANVRVRESR